MAGGYSVFAWIFTTWYGNRVQIQLGVHCLNVLLCDSCKVLVDFFCFKLVHVIKLSRCFVFLLLPSSCIVKKIELEKVKFIGYLPKVFNGNMIKKSCCVFLAALYHDGNVLTIPRRFTPLGGQKDIEIGRRKDNQIQPYFFYWKL